MREFCALFICLLLLVGCSEDIKTIYTSEHSDISIQKQTKDDVITNNEIIRVSWEFKTSINDEGYGEPRTKVFLKLSGNENRSIYIDEYIGYLEEVTPQTCTWEFPENSIMRVFGWYGGSGDLLCLVREKPDKLVVKHKQIEESGGDPKFAEELKKLKFAIIKSIDIRKESKVESLNSINIK